MPRQPIVPEPANRPRGTVYILAEECKGCGLCIELCPRGILTYSVDTNLKGHHFPVVTETGLCANCQVCTLICSEFAIFSLPAVQFEQVEGQPSAAHGVLVESSHASGGKGIE